MLMNHLGQHPELYAYPYETYVLPYFIRRQKNYGNLAESENFRKLWKDITSSYVFRAANKGRVLDLPDDWQDVSRNAAGVFDRIMCEFAASVGKHIWMEKTPRHVQHIVDLAAELEHARFIHIIRDGRDCAASNHRRWGRHPCGTMNAWKNAVRAGRRQGKLIGDRYLELKYESVTSAPEKSLARACEFLGLGFNRSVLQTDRPRIHMTGQSSKTIVKRPDRNKRYFSDERLRTLEGIGGLCLQDCGYDLCFVPGDADPNLLRRGVWTLHDGIRTMVRHVRDKLTSQKRMTFSLMFRRWKMILQSKMTK